MSRKGAFWAVLMIIILITMLYIMESTSWQRQDMVSLGKPLREITYPLQQGFNIVADGINNFIGYFNDNSELRKENQKLQALLDEQSGKLVEMRDMRQENLRLSNLLNYKNSYSDNYELCLAQVIGRDPNNWNQTIIINQGSIAGLEVDMSVITPLGLVGRIISITQNTSEVLLLVDNESAIGARVLESRITPGVVQGIGQTKHLEMIHLSHDEDIYVGNSIITSGFSSIFPKGLQIGLVEDVIMDPTGLTKKAIIKPYVDFSRLEEVMVIRQVLATDSEEALENPDYVGDGGAIQ